MLSRVVFNRFGGGRRVGRALHVLKEPGSKPGTKPGSHSCPTVAWGRGKIRRLGGGGGRGSSEEIPRSAPRDPVLSWTSCPLPPAPGHTACPGLSEALLGLAGLAQLTSRLGGALPGGGLPRGPLLRRGLATPSPSGGASGEPMGLEGGKAGSFKRPAGLPGSFTCQPWAGPAS